MNELEREQAEIRRDRLFFILMGIIGLCVCLTIVFFISIQPVIEQFNPVGNLIVIP